jgi:hypothetical protein
MRNETIKNMGEVRLRVQKVDGRLVVARTEAEFEQRG